MAGALGQHPPPAGRAGRPHQPGRPLLTPREDDADRLDWLRLARSPGVGPRGFVRLLQRFGTAAAALEALPRVAPRSGGPPLSPAPIAAAAAEMEAAARAGARLLRLGAPDYPPPLAEIADPPPLLWALGDPALALQPCVAIAGARNASAAGRRLAGLLAAGLGEAGWVVVSGLARGIDAAAHEAALPTGTVALHAGGVDVIYPAENAALAAAIAAHGLRLSEAPMGEAPVARSFPRRNRLVSGLSAGVILVEAAERSGSLITARLAAEQGREVMAVPGSPLDPRAAGCNALIREGATLTRDAADALQALAAPAAPRLAPRPAPGARPGAPVSPADVASGMPPAEAADAARVAALLSPTPVGFDALCRAAGLSPAALSAALLELDLQGRIDRRPGGLIALAP